MARLRRSDPSKPGWTRRRSGTGFSYRDTDGTVLTGSDRGRCQALAIPPAWTDVWICPWPNGHVQAVGTDAAGRRQYLYHPQWREKQDRVKFERMAAFGEALPAARAQVARHLALPGMPRERALAAGFRLMDRAGLRVGGEAYARQNGSVGVATLRREHASTSQGHVHVRFHAQVRGAAFDDAALARGYQGDSDAGLAQQHQALAVVDMEGLDLAPIAVEGEVAIGQRAVDVEAGQAHARGAGEDRLGDSGEWRDSGHGGRVVRHRE